MTSTRRATSVALGVALAVTLGAAAAVPATAAPAPAPRTEKASIAPDGTDGNGPSGGPSLSADGRLLAFVSSADNLVAGDTDGAADAFVRDLRTGTTRMAGGSVDGSVDGVALSGNGRYLAFSAIGTGDGLSHIWVEDLRTGAVQRLKDTVDTGYDTARQPAISADGRYVAFVAQQSAPGEGEDRWGRVYRVDRTGGKAVRISQVPAAGDRKTAAAPSISADGKRVGYRLFVPHPASGDWSDVYVRDVPSGGLIQADRAPDGRTSDGQSEFPQVSADGRYAVFNSLDSRLTPGDTNQGHNVFVRDLKTGELRRIDAADPAAFTAYPGLSADGRHLAFVSADPGDTNRTTRAYVRDLRTGRTVLASPDAQGGPNDQSVSAPVTDRDGRTVAFGSSSADLVPGDTYDTSHVYVRHVR
ncbi:hypothetical protein ACIPSH_40480 [Streptomyces iakyrus]|uniref:TolB family protein n=1 Tax=Streptomyces iakyrus TaxID=68219 RepID=UPI0037FFCA3B